MPGAGKKRGKIDKRNQTGPSEDEPPPAGQASGGYDGTPSGPPSGPSSGRGRQESVGQSARSASREPSAAREAAGPQTHKDPARDHRMILNKNIDFPGNAYNLISQIVIGNGAEKRGLIRSVWASKKVKQELGNGFIFDGNKIGWSMTDFKNEISLVVDLDQERAFTPRPGRQPNEHRVSIRKTNAVNLAALQGYLDGRMQFNNTVLEAITFLDHLLRETPSNTHIAQKRSYFGREPGGDRALLGGGIEAMKGVYQSIRPAEGKRLVVNVDVSNTCFWHETSVSQLARQVTNTNSMQECINAIQPERASHKPGATNAMKESYHFAALRRLAKNDIRVLFRGASDAIKNKVHKIHRVSDLTARTHTFDVVDRASGVTHKDMTVEDYFKEKYHLALEFPELPLLQMRKKEVYYPMECCVMDKGQKYPFKLDEHQTSGMIKFAVSRPNDRRKAIQDGLKMLDWRNDPYLSNYGLKIDPNMLRTDARILPPPDIAYAKGGVAKPGFSGRWDLRGKTFLFPNPAPLKSWGVSLIGRPPNKVAVDQFIKTFIATYRGHGGVVENVNPIVQEGGWDGADAVKNLFNAVGNANKYRPQLFFFILPTKNAEMYNRIKKSADCRFGIVSQCIQSAHVIKNQAQYHSNVCMKVNAKLGGTTCKVISRNPTGSFTVPTMIIGADVSHAAPGSNGASFAAMTMSMDKIGARYAAAVQTNGVRVEIISSRNIEDMLKPLIQNWAETVGGGRLPHHVYYFRDGVSEGQYQEVISKEVADVKRIMNEFGKHNPNHNTKYTVIIAEKRHHIRFFPPPGPAADRNQNPLPGTLVEKDVTHPFEYDFYLCSHVAIQGTARPTHYHILMDECDLKGDAFQTMLYEHSYQYMRATTPVSLFPAVYYAHLASNRARSHLDISETQLQREKSGHSSSERPETEIKPLIKMANNTGIWWTMWYI
ncbi:hypothetical protein MMC07_008940 [Pseudocyphellaria aurata]|nr:hypothetical protein [Pseudocyphellaria aurata]